MTELRPDQYDLNRFVEAQDSVYDRALVEIRAARKRSHWMWFIFPQFEGLGVSPTAQHFAIKSLEEARAYLAHPLLGRRLSECIDELLGLKTASASEIFGYPDDRKLHSSATLFAHVSPPASEFHRLLDKFFAGEPDRKTLALVK